MPPRLRDLYQPGDRVEICFDRAGLEEWLPGEIAGFQHPGVWVRTLSGGLWFVTNTRRIRPLES